MKWVKQYQLPHSYSDLILTQINRWLKEGYIKESGSEKCSSTTEEHLETVEKVMKILTDNNITLNKKKCHFLRSRINTLGFALSHNQNYLFQSLQKTYTRF
jgi:hypothetical protein